MIFKAEIGDYLYIIIFAVLMLLGSLEKIMKSKRQQNNPPPTPPPHSYDEFEDVDSEHVPAPQTIEEMMKRMMQTMETQQYEEANSYQGDFGKYYQPIEMPVMELPEITESLSDDEEETSVFQPIEFDLRQAVIASEILNRKYWSIINYELRITEIKYSEY